MLELGMDTGLDGGETTLYPRCGCRDDGESRRRLRRPDLRRRVRRATDAGFALGDGATAEPDPLLKDARKPATYAHVVEPVDVLVQDVATRGQARVARLNRQFLREDGRLLLAIKARSEDVTRAPADVFEDALTDLEAAYEVLETERLSPYHEDHLGVIARPTADGTL